MAVIIRFDLDVSEMTIWLLYNCSRGVQYEIKFINKKGDRPTLYAIISMQNEPILSCAIQQFLTTENLLRVFLQPYVSLGLAS